MAKTNLEKSITGAVEGFVMEIIKSVKDATLQELLALQQGGLQAPKRPSPKPGRKPGRKKPGPKPKRKPGRPPKAKKAAKKTVLKPKAKLEAKPVKKKRVVKNYPKCTFPGCSKNRFPRGKGFCGDHWRQFTAGEIKAAAEYKK